MPDSITITLTHEEAKRFSYGLADLLCWHRGFSAAREGTDLDNNGPMGVESARDLRLKILSQLERSGS